MIDLIDNNEKLAWMARDLLLRGSLSLVDAKRHVITLLFLRFLDAVSQHRELHASSPELAGEDIWRDLRISPRINFDALVTSSDPVRRIKDILNELEQKNNKILGGVFAALRFDEKFLSAFSPGLVSALKLFNQMNLLPEPKDSSTAAMTFERIIDRFAAAEGKHGEFDTPADLAYLIAEITSPAPGESIYDPACRSGSLLVSAVMLARKPGLIVGQTRSLQDWSTCRIRMIMQATMDADIRCGDALSIANRVGDGPKFDVVISNPPFGQAHDVRREFPLDSFARSDSASLRGVRSEFAFLLHMIESAKEHTGRVGALLPAGALFRGGGESLIRRGLIEQNMVDCVVSLPANLFYGTSIPVVLLVLHKGRKEDEAITFIDASQDFEPGRSRSRLSKKHAAEIVKAFKSKHSMEGYSYKATTDEVRSRDFNLSPGRFVKASICYNPPSNIQTLENEAQEIERKLDSVRKELDSCLEALKD